MTKKNEKNSSRNILTAFLLNFFFVIIEVVGGIFTGSVAILSDSIHDFGDCISIFVAYFFEKKSNKNVDKTYTFGYRRYSVISAMLTSAILLVGGAVVIYTSVLRIIEPRPIDGMWMFIIAIFGVLINGIAVFETAKSRNINEKSINLHMLEDVLGWVVVLIGSIFVWTLDVYILDPILSILVSIYVIYHAIKNLVYAISIVLEKSPKWFEYDTYKGGLERIDGVKSVHHLHIWTLDGESLLATLHVVVDDSEPKDKVCEIKNEINQYSRQFNIVHLTIQIDFQSLDCEDENCHIVQTIPTVDPHHHH